VRKIRNAVQSSYKPGCDVTFARKFLRGKQMTACEQITAHAVVVDCISDRAPTRGRAVGQYPGAVALLVKIRNSIYGLS